jgi:flagellar biogenesis protein FliO
MNAVSKNTTAIPFKPEAVASDPDGWRVLGSLLICVLLLALILYLVRRYLPQAGKSVLGGGQRVQVLETRRLGPGHTLHVVRFGQRDILIGQSAQGLVRLASTALPGQTGATCASDACAASDTVGGAATMNPVPEAGHA